MVSWMLLEHGTPKSSTTRFTHFHTKASGLLLRTGASASVGTLDDTCAKMPASCSASSTASKALMMALANFCESCEKDQAHPISASKDLGALGLVLSCAAFLSRFSLQILISCLQTCSANKHPLLLRNRVCSRRHFEIRLVDQNEIGKGWMIPRVQGIS